jgi:chromosomal replication initiator protein
MNDLDEVWAKCSAELRQEIPEPAWKAWTVPLRLIDAAGDKFVFAAPNSVVREVVLTRYIGLFQRILAQHTGANAPEIEILVQPSPVAEPLAAHNGDPSVDLDEALVGPAHVPSGDEDSSGAPTPNWASSPEDQPPRHGRNGRRDQPNLNPRYTFDAFVIGASNRFAHAAARCVAEDPAKAYNPLFIYGGSGLGKTHMLHAIGHYVLDNFPNFSVCYVSTETFLDDFIDAIRTKSQTSFKRRYRGYHVLLVDDVQLLEGKTGTQEEFFHTFNSFYETERQIVLSSDRHPRDIATLEDRLRSRFECGLMTDVQPPELETRLAILRKKSEGLRAAMPEEVLELIATHIKDNIRELEGALTRIAAYASIHDVPVTLALAEELLQDVIRASPPKPVTLQQILDVAAKSFGFSPEEITGVSRRRPLVQARQAAMYVARHLTDSSFPQIAEFFGGRDHTTVIHAQRKIAKLMEENVRVYEQVTELMDRVKKGD